MHCFPSQKIHSPYIIALLSTKINRIFDFQSHFFLKDIYYTNTTQNSVLTVKQCFEILCRSGRNGVFFMIAFGCKAIGLAALAFCIGIVAGLILPIYIVAVIEAVLLVLMGYCCLFKW